jgi:hypothetical protein
MYSPSPQIYYQHLTNWNSQDNHWQCGPENAYTDRRMSFDALTCFAHQSVGRTKQTVQPPELRPRQLALSTVQVVTANKPVCAVPAGIRPRSGLRPAQTGLAQFRSLYRLQAASAVPNTQKHPELPPRRVLRSTCVEIWHSRIIREHLILRGDSPTL